MIVADTNLIAYLLIPGELTNQAEMAFERDSFWVAPLLWRSEFRSVLAFYLRRNSLSLEESLQIMIKAERLLKGQEYSVRSSRVLSLAARSRCSAYDCEFVTLAQELGISLVTSDRLVLTEFPSTAVPLDSFVVPA